MSFALPRKKSRRHKPSAASSAVNAQITVNAANVLAGSAGVSVPATRWPDAQRVRTVATAPATVPGKTPRSRQVWAARVAHLLMNGAAVLVGLVVGRLVLLFATMVLPALEQQSVAAQQTTLGLAIVLGLGAARLTQLLIAPPMVTYLRRQIGLPAICDDDSMAGHQNFVQAILVTLVVFLIASLLMETLIHRGGTASPMTIGPARTIQAFVALIAAGVGFHLLGHLLFRNSRGRKTLQWHHHRRGGMAILDYTPAWDHPRKTIYAKCRGSRRVAAAYRSNTVAAAACFAAAGSLIATLSVSSRLADVAVVLCMLAILALWPTSTRMIAWTKAVLGRSGDSR